LFINSSLYVPDGQIASTVSLTSVRRKGSLVVGDDMYFVYQIKSNCSFVCNSIGDAHLKIVAGQKTRLEAFWLSLKKKRHENLNVEYIHAGMEARNKVKM
jgi:hypothetical protein